MNPDLWTPGDVPLDKPSAARMYDYLLGGFHNLQIDRQAAAALTSIYPDAPLVARTNRAFLRRVVQFFLAQGLDQFLDIGSGIPTVGNVHEVAQEAIPDARVVYVDNDPVAVAHSQAILSDHPYAAVVQGDARLPEQMLTHLKIQGLLDFSRPIGLLLVTLLHFVTDDREAQHVVRTFRDALPSGSFIALSHGTLDHVPADITVQLEQLYARTANPIKLRSQAEIAHFFTGLALIEPGVVYAPLWHPEGPDDLLLDEPARSTVFVGVGRKP